MKDASKIDLEVRGKYLFHNMATDSEITPIRPGKKSDLITSGNEIYWKEEMTELPDVRLVPASLDTIISVNGTPYKGCIEIHNRNGLLTLINEVDVEDFLKSTLAGKFTETLEPEVWQAISITERTSLYYLIQKKGNVPFHFKAEEIDYQGTISPFQDPICDNALEATRHVVLTYQDKCFPALVTNDCGGKTANFTSLFRRNISAPAGVVIPTSYRKEIENGWSFQITKTDLENLFSFSDMQGIDLYSDKASGKVYAVRLRNADASQEVRFFELQNKLGKNKLRSSNFSIKLEDGNIIFTGVGVGHGVGLCLSSSNAMARFGTKAPKILSSFFPDTQLKVLKRPES